MSHASLKERAQEELRNYLIVSAYLYVAFAVLMLYENSVLRQAGAGLLPHGIAIVKALVLGKFILIGEAIGAGKRLRAATLARHIAGRSLAILLVLVVLTVIEELIAGKVHGRSMAEMLAEVEQQGVLGLLAKCLLMLMILLPLIVTKEINRELGPGVLRGLLFGPAPPDKARLA